MAEKKASQKGTKNTSSKIVRATASQPLSSDKNGLIKLNEVLVKKEDGAIIVRNSQGKLIRRKFGQEDLPEVIDLMKEEETLVKEEEDSIVVRTTQGKLVRRRLAQNKHKTESSNENLTKPAKVSVEKEPETQTQEPEQDNNLWERISKRHSFLERMESGGSIADPQKQAASSSTMQVVETDRVEDVEDAEDDLEDIAPDASVTELETAVTADSYQRSIGKGASKGVKVGASTSRISSGAINPNARDNDESKKSSSLAGNASNEPQIVIAQPEKKEVKKKKAKKPIKSWIIIVVLISVYLVASLTYFFVAYNFDPKQVDVILYYINVGEDAKLEYYDGEKFNFNELYMTYYYSKDKVENSSIGESNFAETTIGMGYSVNKGYISALWVDSYATASQRTVKVKFNCDDLVCYVPVTIYRNKLVKLEKYFDLTEVYAGLEIQPTVFGLYSNKVLEDSDKTIRKEMSQSEYDILLNYNGGENYSLKNLECYEDGKYVLPETIEGVGTIDYSLVKLYIISEEDGYSDAQGLLLYE